MSNLFSFFLIFSIFIAGVTKYHWIVQFYDNITQFSGVNGSNARHHVTQTNLIKIYYNFRLDKLNLGWLDGFKHTSNFFLRLRPLCPIEIGSGTKWYTKISVIKTHWNCLTSSLGKSESIGCQYSWLVGCVTFN